MTELDRSEVPAPGAPLGRHYVAFNLSAATWFAAWGLQMVLFTWILVGELNVNPSRLGFAQFVLTLPAPLFLLVGGVTADRYDRRILLMGLHALAGLVALGLAFATYTGHLSYELVLLYALLLGTIQAFVFPSRDALLNQVAGTNMLRTVAGVTLVQFSLQAAGAMSGGVLQRFGTELGLACQGLLLLLGIFPLFAIPKVPLRPREPLRLSEILAGIGEVFHSPVMRPPMILTAGIGLFFMGPYFVAFPVMVRETWGGAAEELGYLQAVFPIAVVIGTLLVLARGAIRRKGRALVLAQGGGALCLLAISTGVSFRAALGIALIWGLCGSVFLNVSRTLFQTSAPETHRARVLSVYNLGFMGAGVIGLPLAGVLTEYLGPHGAFRVGAFSMLLFLLVVSLATDLRRVE